jgi:hypothetical protein
MRIGSKSWKPLIYILKEWRKPAYINIMGDHFLKEVVPNWWVMLPLSFNITEMTCS